MKHFLQVGVGICDTLMSLSGSEILDLDFEIMTSFVELFFDGLWRRKH